MTITNTTAADPTHSPHSHAAIWGTPQAIAAVLAAEKTGPVDAAADILAAAPGRTFLVGTGSSYHVACIVESLLRVAGEDAWAVSAYEFARYPRPLRPDDAVVIFSHTGAKHYSVEAVNDAVAAGLTPVVITAQGSSLPEGTGGLVVPTVPREKSAMYTVSLMGAITVGAQIAAGVAERVGMGSFAVPIRAGLAWLPEIFSDLLVRSDAIRDIAAAARARGGRFYFVGAGPNRATGMEHALKVREGSYLTAEGGELENFIHGPMVGLEAADCVTLVAPPGESLTRSEDFLRALDQIGCMTWVQGGPTAAPATYTDPLPDLPEVLSPCPALLLGQLFAYHLAGLQGTNADTFRRDHDTYRAAVSALKL